MAASANFFGELLSIFIAVSSHQSLNHEWRRGIACTPRWSGSQACHAAPELTGETLYGTAGKVAGLPDEPAAFGWQSRVDYDKQHIPPLSPPDARAQMDHASRCGTEYKFLSAS